MFVYDSYYGYSQAGGNLSNYFKSDEYKSFYSSYMKKKKDTKKKNEIKKEFREKTSKALTPINLEFAYGGKKAKTKISKTFKMNITLADEDLRIFKDNENQIIQDYKKVPINSSFIYTDGFYVRNFGGEISDRLFESCKLEKPDEIRRLVSDYFSGRITQKEYSEKFDPEKVLKFDEQERKITESGNSAFSSGTEVGTYGATSNIELKEKFLRTIKSKVILTDKIERELNMFKGKRINRSAMVGTSNKTFINKTVEGRKKKKIMFIIDCSGSMRDARMDNSPMHKAMSFVHAVKQSGIFDVTHSICHSEYGWEDVNLKIDEHNEKNQIFSYSGGDEGFESIGINLKEEWIKEVDYAILITDLIFDSDQQRAIVEYMSMAKLHRTFSFHRMSTVKELRTSLISKPEDLVNNLIRMTS